MSEATQRARMTYVSPPTAQRKQAPRATTCCRRALRNFVRNRETGVVSVAVVIGLLSGLLVAAISKLSEIAHALLFDIPLTRI